MPKMRSHSGTKKRFKITGTGKVLRRKSGTSHLAPGKTQKQTRHLRKSGTVSPSDMKRIGQMLSNI